MIELYDYGERGGTRTHDPMIKGHPDRYFTRSQSGHGPLGGQSSHDDGTGVAGLSCLEQLFLNLVSIDKSTSCSIGSHMRL
jgi:hypothetical protein